MKKTKKMLSFVLSMLLIVTMFPTMAFAKEEAKTWKFGELSLKAGDVLGKDTEIKNDAENREIRILSEKTNPDEKKDQKDDKERIKTEKEADCSGFLKSGRILRKRPKRLRQIICLKRQTAGTEAGL